MIVEFPTPIAARKIRPGGRVRVCVAGLAACIAVAQFLPAPRRTNPPVSRNRTLEAAVAVPHPVGKLLGRACANCHSDRTEWPWYSRVAPLSWMIGSHVREGREAMNF